MVSEPRNDFDSQLVYSETLSCAVCLGRLNGFLKPLCLLKTDLARDVDKILPLDTTFLPSFFIPQLQGTFCLPSS